MGLLSSTSSVTRYQVEGKFEKSVLESVEYGLKRYTFKEVDDDISEKIVGWTSFDNPFNPNFEGHAFSIGTYLVFSMRIDKKAIPSKLIKKYYTLEEAKLLAKSGRQYLSREEKKSVKDEVINFLSSRIPATPYVYDLIWNYEKSTLWFFSNMRAANEELEILFSNSFKLILVRLFPYTTADLAVNLSQAERDTLLKLSPTKFME